LRGSSAGCPKKQFLRFIIKQKALKIYKSAGVKTDFICIFHRFCDDVSVRGWGNNVRWSTCPRPAGKQRAEQFLQRSQLVPVPAHLENSVMNSFSNGSSWYLSRRAGKQRSIALFAEAFEMGSTFPSDGKAGLLQTMNFCSQSYTNSRFYAILRSNLFCARKRKRLAPGPFMVDEDRGYRKIRRMPRRTGAPSGKSKKQNENCNRSFPKHHKQV
jgi:hypothetical protein